MEYKILDVDTKAGVAYISGTLADGTPIGSLFGDVEYNGKNYNGQYVKRMTVPSSGLPALQPGEHPDYPNGREAVSLEERVDAAILVWLADFIPGREKEVAEQAALATLSGMTKTFTQEDVDAVKQKFDEEQEAIAAAREAEKQKVLLRAAGQVVEPLPEEETPLPQAPTDAILEES